MNQINQMNQRSETSSSLFLDTAHGETVCSIAAARRIHAATADAQVVTVILAVRRRNSNSSRSCPRSSCYRRRCCDNQQQGTSCRYRYDQNLLHPK